MTERLQAFRNQVDDAVTLWQANVCNPYIQAYNTAYKSYTDTFAKQKESDKARAELFVSVAAILPGSILMATAATSSMRVLAGRAALKALAHQSVSRVLRVYNAVGANPTAVFALGKVLDVVKDQAGKTIKDAVVQAMQHSSGLLATDPLNRDKQLNSWLLNHKILAFDAASAIENDRSLNGAAKDHAFALLRQAPIASRPQGRIDIDRLALKIELGFYMIWLLDSDELVTQVLPDSYYGPGRYTSKRIDEMPSSPRYPRANVRPGVANPSWVGVTRPGRDVEDRIDEVNKKVRGRLFYEPGMWILGKDDRKKLKEVAAAERVLTWLSASTQPLTPLGVRT